MDKLSELYGTLKELEEKLGIDVSLDTGLRENHAGKDVYYCTLRIGYVSLGMEGDSEQNCRHRLVRDFYEESMKKFNEPFKVEE